MSQSQQSQQNQRDPYRLDRFVQAQDHSDAYTRALSELGCGRKQSHWMWFVFPQIAGLGHSAVSRQYAITSLPEAQAYLHHPVLGPRLLECTRSVAALTDRSTADIFGSVDALKLHSSMTLFARAAPDVPVFRQVLQQYFDGAEDRGTIQRL